MSPERIGVLAVHIDLSEQRPRILLVLVDFAQLLVVLRFLAAKLVAGERKDLQASGLVLLVERVEFSVVLLRQASFECNVDDLNVRF